MIPRLRRFRQGLLAQFPFLQPSSPTYRWWVLATVMVATFMAVLDATILNVALPKLMATFGVTVDRVDWVLNAYLLVFSVMLPTSGWLADHLGYKRMFFMSLFLFTLGSLLCSFSRSLNMLIAFRVVQGVGAGILMPLGLAIITSEFPPEKRGVALGFWSVAASASVSLGPTIGGYLVDHYAWKTIFDVNIPIGVFGMAAVSIILRERRAETSRRFDLPGFFSLAVFLTALLLALANGNSAWNTGGWTSTFILTCFAVAGVGLLTFLLLEFSVEHPLIDLRLFENRNFAITNAIMFLFGLGMFGSNFLLPVYLQNGLGYTPLQTGVLFLPVGVLQGLAGPLAGVFADRAGPKLPVILGIVLMSFTLYQFSFLSILTEKHQIMPTLYLRGLSMGILFPPLTAMAISEIPNRKMAQASGLLTVIRQIGGTVGVAMFGSILVRRTIFHGAVFGQQLDPGSPVTAQTLARLQHYAAGAAGKAGAQGTAAAKGVIVSFMQNQAFIRAVDDVFLMAAVILVVSAVPVAFVRIHRKHKGGGRAAPKATPAETG